MHASPFALGIDFGGTSIKIGLVKEHEVIDHAPPISTKEYESAEALIEDIFITIGHFRQKHGDIKAVGVGVPGFVRQPDGLVHRLTNVQGWNSVPLRTIIENETGLPSFVDNDANAMAYAEWKLGAGKGCSNLIALTLGTGVGSGIIINGQLIRGARSAAGELGQTSIDFAGRIGSYGNKGALEDYIGNNELAAKARELYRKAEQYRSLDSCSPKALATAALAQDPIALTIWDELAEKLACALMNCCYLLNPERFIIGGGVAQAGELIFGPLREKLYAQLGEPFRDKLTLVPAQFGNEAGILGAAHLAIDSLN